MRIINKSRAPKNTIVFAVLLTGLARHQAICVP